MGQRSRPDATKHGDKERWSRTIDDSWCTAINDWWCKSSWSEIFEFLRRTPGLHKCGEGHQFITQHLQEEELHHGPEINIDRALDYRQRYQIRHREYAQYEPQVDQLLWKQNSVFTRWNMWLVQSSWAEGWKKSFEAVARRAWEDGKSEAPECQPQWSQILTRKSESLRQPSRIGCERQQDWIAAIQAVKLGAAQDFEHPKQQNISAASEFQFSEQSTSFKLRMVPVLWSTTSCPSVWSSRTICDRYVEGVLSLPTEGRRKIDNWKIEDLFRIYRLYLYFQGCQWDWPHSQPNCWRYQRIEILDEEKMLGTNHLFK